MHARASFKEVTKASFFLYLEDPESLETYLREHSWLEEGEAFIAVEKPGEGNMNHVVRVVTDRRSFIVKQSRPWVEKYPQIAAPVERTLVEAAFYEFTGRASFFRDYTPDLIGKDSSNYLLLFEDLGQGADFTHYYQKGMIFPETELQQLVQFLSRLHRTAFSVEDRRGFPDNLAMRRLNHQHLFVFPFMEDNGFDLDQIQPGLQQLALPYKKDQALKKVMLALGERYLSQGTTLLHGDFFPGSWMQVGQDVKVIDPEFCFFGPAEYDIGVMLAHLMMARVPDPLIQRLIAWYNAPSNFDQSLQEAFTGMELMRRLIGLAQLPLDLSLEEKKELLAKGRTLF